MLNMGKSADGVLPERALALAADRTSGSMTLGERVHGLFEQLRVPVFRYLLRKTRDSGRAEDITQETWLQTVNVPWKMPRQGYLWVISGFSGEAERGTDEASGRWNQRTAAVALS